MPKKDKKSKKDKKQAGSADAATAGAVEAVEAVRSAVERTFAATAESAQQLAGPAQQFAGEVAVAANRIREVLEDRVLDELKHLRTELEGLARRVQALEVTPEPPRRRRAKPATRRRAAAKKPRGPQDGRRRQDRRPQDRRRREDHRRREPEHHTRARDHVAQDGRELHAGEGDDAAQAARARVAAAGRRVTPAPHHRGDHRGRGHALVRRGRDHLGHADSGWAPRSPPPRSSAR